MSLQESSLTSVELVQGTSQSSPLWILSIAVLRVNRCLYTLQAADFMGLESELRLFTALKAEP